MLRLAPAMHGHRHEVWTLLEVAKDGEALGACASTHGPQSQHPPLVAGRPAQPGPTSSDPIQRSVDSPERPNKPARRGVYGSRTIRSADHPKSPLGVSVPLDWSEA